MADIIYMHSPYGACYATDNAQVLPLIGRFACDCYIEVYIVAAVFII